MVERCNDAGVRIYVDAIINHLTPTNGVGTAGSVFRGEYLEFPDVPYGDYYKFTKKNYTREANY